MNVVKKIREQLTVIKYAIPIVIVIIGIIISLYVGGKICFLDGLTNVIDMLKSSDYNGLKLAKNILRILVAYPTCGIINVIFIFIAEVINKTIDKMLDK
ncbi:TPA: hypothetical protein KN238_000074 [Clostridioides difficile]|nr:hypothetical protein [Clostridioides difficile]HBF3756645.1 hypothetical protein [Clostridioides difficile]HBF6246982.1 hypothetical protein [Clostridioides difficile]HBY3218735.1 hypothetical protein [Clostridioides difficile]